MNELDSNDYRGLLVGGAILLWMWALMGGARSSDIVTTSRPATASLVSTSRANEEQPPPPPDAKFEDVTELVIKSPKRRSPKPTPGAIGLVPTALVSAPTYQVWFESERDLGKCKIIWKDGSMIANLHASARLPEGTLVFSYACGNRRGRASIDVQPKRVNGVLFCEDAGDVKVATVRREDGQCKHS